MNRADISESYLNEKTLSHWARAMSYVAAHYRIACSPGMLQANAPWFKDKSLLPALTQLARQAGLSVQLLEANSTTLGSWRLPVVATLDDGQLAIVERFDGESTVDVCFIDDEHQRNRLPLADLMPRIEYVVALRPLSALRDSRVDNYVSRFSPDWLKVLVLKDLRPYGPVMLAAFLVNVLSLGGIIFSMQVYDRVIPAQSYPTLYVLAFGVLLSVIFGFILRVARSHIMDVLGKRADLRISDRIFSHALRLRNSAIPRSTGSFISQLRELEQIRETITSSTLSTIVDLPFFFLFVVVLGIISPPLAWIAPVAAIVMVLPGILMQKRLAKLANQSAHESTLRNAVLVESVQGLEDIKLMQAENRFLQQWNSYIRITSESALRTRELSQGLISWGITVQSLVYSAVILFGAPMVIEGELTTGSVVAASMLASRMIAPMANLCGVLTRWQQVKIAKAGLDSIMQLPTETQRSGSVVHREIFHGHYLLEEAQFRYHSEDQRIPLKIARLEIRQGERVALLGRNGAGKSTLLHALAGGIDLVSGEARLDDLSLAQIDVADLRRNIGLLSQNARLFYGTLRENLTMGAPHASDQDIFDALDIAGTSQFVQRLPKGLDHLIMEGGNGLSGGQRQSILLARMLLRSPNIVLLDEPTASLDDHTEREFIQRLNQWLGNRTLIVATHRVPVLDLVDRVVVLNDGYIAMDAPKSQVLNQGRASAQAVSGKEWKHENQPT
ncbi:MULTISPECIES: type I secretion system permease/ATPase [Enterobacteriaceae]|uniref:Type I secretion system permease/ATPase n=2 Tax=Kluyvera TaxID=579 RepID=A0A2T2Y027_9ENTR|nr:MULTISPECIES: type I secretion system permease/ATPase [Enterobacteriaceae]HAT3919841.1 type I secretion system permease/ATPase [Kluyvera ascorbata]PSR45890.1 type I secretion system permease/ATPase [Kluyvera genomosp. 2]BBQ82685.1 ATP-binding protein [Klebsiella sp. WP3-W18-ESBL-02]BBR19712.1 ATP-binding protein [Klebsiella sp. WP3-S18-ESBL-05]BBR60056.1 ATP-binding protein [Klebsiella sp. WP4-W18-ESBL-05]